MILDPNERLLESHSYPPRNDGSAAYIAWANLRRSLQNLPPIPLGSIEACVCDESLSVNLSSRSDLIDEIELNDRASDEEKSPSDGEGTPRDVLPTEDAKYANLLQELRKESGETADSAELNGRYRSMTVNLKASSSVSSQKNILKMMNQRMCALERRLQESDRRHDDLIALLRLEHKQAMEEIKQRLVVGLESADETVAFSKRRRVADDVGNCTDEMESSFNVSEEKSAAPNEAEENQLFVEAVDVKKQHNASTGGPCSMLFSTSSPSYSSTAASARDTLNSRSDSISPSDSFIDSSLVSPDCGPDVCVQKPTKRNLASEFNKHANLVESHRIGVLLDLVVACQAFLARVLLGLPSASRLLALFLEALTTAVAWLITASSASVLRAHQACIHYTRQLAQDCVRGAATAASVLWACGSAVARALRRVGEALAPSSPRLAEGAVLLAAVLGAVIFTCAMLHTLDTAAAGLPTARTTLRSGATPSAALLHSSIAAFERAPEEDGCGGAVSVSCGAGELRSAALEEVKSDWNTAAAKQNSLNRMVRFSALEGVFRLATGVRGLAVHMKAAAEDEARGREDL